MLFLVCLCTFFLSPGCCSEYIRYIRFKNLRGLEREREKDVIHVWQYGHYYFRRKKRSQTEFWSLNLLYRLAGKMLVQSNSVELLHFKVTIMMMSLSVCRESATYRKHQAIKCEYSPGPIFTESSRRLYTNGGNDMKIRTHDVLDTTSYNYYLADAMVISGMRCLAMDNTYIYSNNQLRSADASLHLHHYRHEAKISLHFKRNIEIVDVGSIFRIEDWTTVNKNCKKKNLYAT